MARRVTPAQARAAIRKAAQDQKRAVDDYNRAVRKHNAAVEKAVSDYNREVRAYNSRVRARNRDLEGQRRRVRQEMQRLNSRAAPAGFVTIRTSTRTFVRTYEAADAALSGRVIGAADQHILDLVRHEAANSAYLANALEGDGAQEEDLDEEDLRSPSLADELAFFGQDLVDRWTGALFSLSPSNPDAARHFCTSAREVVVSMLDTSAPDAEVLLERPFCDKTDSGAPTRRAKIGYLLDRHGVSEERLSDVVAADVENLLSLFRAFNDGTHGHAGRFTLTELTALRIRSGGCCQFRAGGRKRSESLTHGRGVPRSLAGFAAAANISTSYR